MCDQGDDLRGPVLAERGGGFGERAAGVCRGCGLVWWGCGGGGGADRPCRRLGWRICLLRCRRGSSVFVSVVSRSRVGRGLAFETSFLGDAVLEMVR